MVNLFFLGNLLRHDCSHDHKLRYGWTAHDGVYFGEQEIHENDFDITTKLVKRPRLGNHGGDWSWKIEAKSEYEKAEAVTFMVYFAIEKGNGRLEPNVESGKLTGNFREYLNF